MSISHTTLVVCSSLLVMSTFLFTSGSASFAYSMAESCQYYTGLIADPNDCQSYGYCKDGKLLGTQKCPTGYKYDRGSAKCDYDSSAVCAAGTAANICSQYSAPTFIMNPTNCSEYCYCNNNKNEGCAGCPINQGFSADQQRCTWIGTSFCPLKSICGLLPDYKFAADPNPLNCGNYILCRGGAEPYGSHACDNSLIYNPETGMCEDDSDFCSGVITGDTPSGEGKCATGTETYVTDGVSCAGYFYCDGKGVNGVYGRCPRGLHFDSAGSTTIDGNDIPGSCTNPLNVKCEADRCDNVNLPFMTALGSSCNKYIRCQNGTTITPNGISEVACPDDFEYFDEQRQGCVKEVPTFVNGDTTETYPICA